MAGRQTYSDEVKASAMSALMAGQGVGKVAEEYQIPVGTVKSWKKRASLEMQPVASPKKEAIGDLLLKYLDTNLKTLEKQSEVFGDPEWIREQSASELAVLHGVLTDKTVRLLEALGGPKDQ